MGTPPIGRPAGAEGSTAGSDSDGGHGPPYAILLDPYTWAPSSESSFLTGASTARSTPSHSASALAT